MTGNAADKDAEPHLIFDLGERRFSIPASAVRQVAELPAVLNVPGSSPPYPGLVVLRGKLLSVLDLSLLLGTGINPAPSRRCLIVLDSASGGRPGGAVGIAVDAVRGVTLGTTAAGTLLDLESLLGNATSARS